jgi:hypothetical protein
MEIIIKNENFDIKNIKFKYGKKCIKIIYDLKYILMIGLTFKISPFKIIENDNILFIYLNRDDDDFEQIKKIDEFLQKSFRNYKSFLNDNIIRVKKHTTYNKNEIYITINNLKKN